MKEEEEKNIIGLPRRRSFRWWQGRWPFSQSHQWKWWWSKKWRTAPWSLWRPAGVSSSSWRLSDGIARCSRRRGDGCSDCSICQAFCRTIYSWPRSKRAWPRCAWRRAWWWCSRWDRPRLRSPSLDWYRRIRTASVSGPGGPGSIFSFFLKSFHFEWKIVGWDK